MRALNTELAMLLNAPDETGRSYKPFTLSQLEEFERSEGVNLTDSLISFWLNYGSRDLNSKKIFAFKTKVVFPDGKKKKADVNAIAGPGKMIEARQRYIDPLYGNSGERLPAGLYPLTFDSGYGHCLLDLNADTHGRILYIVIKAKTFGDAGYGWDQVGTVAKDFDEFLAGLTPDYL
jgi:hypothetical protein